MGHCEMLLAVAGLDQKAVAERARRLSEGDWSRFSPQEQAAFAFARHLESPKMAKQEFKELVAHLGPARATDVLWWTSHCHYMTRVADALQVPLEKDNVFDGFLSNRERTSRP
jgi:hypothetical protein